VPAKVKELNDTQCVLVAQHRIEEALARHGRGRGAERILELDEALELERRLGESYFRLGEAIYHEGNFVDAVAECKEAIKVKPQSAAAHNLLGLALDKQGLVEQAVLEYRSAVNLEPDNDGYRANLAHELASEHSTNKVSNESETVAKLK